MSKKEKKRAKKLRKKAKKKAKKEKKRVRREQGFAAADFYTQIKTSYSAG